MITKGMGGRPTCLRCQNRHYPGDLDLPPGDRDLPTAQALVLGTCNSISVLSPANSMAWVTSLTSRSAVHTLSRSQYL